MPLISEREFERLPLRAHHTGDLKNVPIVRVGNLASYPSEQIQTRAFGRMEAYLIEARSIGGLSGSPVSFILEQCALSADN
jgi:hypothetical protein